MFIVITQVDGSGPTEAKLEESERSEKQEERPGAPMMAQKRILGHHFDRAFTWKDFRNFVGAEMG